MTDDFEKTLRQRLADAVPAPPEASARADGARGYSRRVRRTRASLAVGAAAAVVGAIVVIPNLGAGSDNSAGVADPFPSQISPTCPPSSGFAHPTNVEEVPAGAVAARLCVAESLRVPWSAPHESLVSDVDGMAKAVNELPTGPIHGCIPESDLPSYNLVFQYEDGQRVVVTSQVNCDYVSVGQTVHSGALDLLQNYLSRLRDQRTHVAPPQSPVAPLSCAAGRNDVRPVLVDGRHPALTQALACSVSVSGENRMGALTMPQIRTLEADLRQNATSQYRGVLPTCYQRGPSATLLISGSNAWGDVVTFVDTCNGVSFIDGSGSWYWTPSAKTLAMLRSAQHDIPVDGRIVGRLLAVGGPAPGAPRPLSGQVTISSSGGDYQVRIGRDGRFSVDLPPGRYRVVGHSPSYNDGNSSCGPERPLVTVTDGHTALVNVLCQEK